MIRVIALYTLFLLEWWIYAMKDVASVFVNWEKAPALDLFHSFQVNQEMLLLKVSISQRYFA